MSFFKKFFSKDKEEDLNKGLEKTKESFFSQITKAVAGKSKVDIEFLDELERILISSDVGLETAVKIIDRLEKKVSEDKYGSPLNCTGEPFYHKMEPCIYIMWCARTRTVDVMNIS